MNFSAHYDRTAKIVSAVVAGFLLMTAAVLHNWLVGVTLPAVMLLAYAFSPRGYAITAESITIRRLVGDVRVKTAAVRYARRASADDMRGCVRLIGSGGLFGYYGWFRTDELGKSHWYVTDRNTGVIVWTSDQVIVLSPGDPDRFLHELGVPDRPAEPEQLFAQTVETFGSSNWPAKLLIAAAVGFGVALVVGAMLYAPGPDSYTLTRQNLTIHDRFYPVTLQLNEIDESGIRIVNLATDPEWRPMRRTNGFSNSHYHSGWYRVANGQKIRLYRTTAERLVLLPPKGTGTPVLYQPPDLERFLAEVRREWAGG